MTIKDGHNRTTVAVLYGAICLHITWAVCLILDGATVGVTAIKVLAEGLGLCHRMEGFLYLFVSAMALLDINYNPVGREKTKVAILRATGLACQQFLVVISAIGAIAAICEGHYLDGTVVSRTHLISDQLIYVIFATVHGIALYSHTQIMHTKRA